MSGAIETIPAQLRSMFLPQVEQIGADMCARGCGIQARVDNELCTGSMWMASVGSDCLVSMHRLTPRRRFHMDECSEHDAMHVAFLSAPAAKCLSDVSAPNMCRPRESVVAYRQAAGPVGFEMHEAASYATAAVSFLPGFFRHLHDLLPSGCPDPEALFDAGTGAGGHTLSEGSPAEIAMKALLTSLNGTASGVGPASQLHLYARVTDAVALLASEVWETGAARRAQGSNAQKQLVEGAQRLIDAHLGEALSLDRLAHELYASRTRLCAAFKQETGMSVGAYIQSRRVARAQELLAHSSLPVQQVAREVGYSRQGSFSEMFRQATGLTPTQWREQAKG